MARRRRRKSGASIGAWAAALLLCLVSAEISLRLAGLLPLSFPSPLRPDEEIGFLLKPTPSSDPEGFNDSPHPANPRKTILVVGDSFVYSTYSADRAFPGRMQQLLPDLAVLNRGLPGAGPDNYVRLVRRELTRSPADLVIVTLYLGNDLGQSSPRQQVRLYLGMQGLLNRPFSFGPYPRDFYLYSALNKLIRATQARFDGPVPVLPAIPQEEGRANAGFADKTLRRIERQQMEAQENPPSAFFRLAHQGLEQYLTAIKQACDGHPLLLVLAPARSQVDPQWRARVLEQTGEPERNFDPLLPNRLITAMAQRLDLPVMDLTPAFASQGGGDLYNRNDTHWNRAGNDLAAQEITKHIPGLLTDAKN